MPAPASAQRDTPIDAGNWAILCCDGPGGVARASGLRADESERYNDWQTDGTWIWQMPTYLEPGPDLGRIYRNRRLVHWPQALLGIDWPCATYRSRRSSSSAE
jgi:hypothetical protein